MAQLTDDCFAFSGPLLPVAEAERRIGTRKSRIWERNGTASRGAWPCACRRCRRAGQSAAIRQFCGVCFQGLSRHETNVGEGPLLTLSGPANLFEECELYPTVPNLVYSSIGPGRLSREEDPWRRA